MRDTFVNYFLRQQQIPKSKSVLMHFCHVSYFTDSNMVDSQKHIVATCVPETQIMHESRTRSNVLAIIG